MSPLIFFTVSTNLPQMSSAFCHSNLKPQICSTLQYLLRNDSIYKFPVIHWAVHCFIRVHVSWYPSRHPTLPLSLFRCFCIWACRPISLGGHYFPHTPRPCGIFLLNGFCPCYQGGDSGRDSLPWPDRIFLCLVHCELTYKQVQGRRCNFCTVRCEPWSKQVQEQCRVL